MYAIVKTGGKQYRVAVGDVLNVEKLDSEPGEKVSLPAVLLVDGSELITDAAALATASVTATVVEQTKGPKIRIHKFKNKTGYHKRQGHRQPLTRLEVTDISAKAGAGPAAKSATKTAATKTAATKTATRKTATTKTATTKTATTKTATTKTATTK